MEIQKKTQRLLRPVKENLSQWLNTVLKPADQTDSKPQFDPESSAYLIFRDCLKVQASDLHLDPFSAGVKVRMRIDGVLHDTAVLSHEQGERLIRYYKTLAELDPVASFKPQDARTQVQIENRRLDLRISCVPCQGGEKMVMRLMDPRKVDRRMQHLGLTEEDRGEMEIWL
jgi:type II secretory ATPase GspE/PulE/Tfp pilus assembly ATPase PilB-like protein